MLFPHDRLRQPLLRLPHRQRRLAWENVPGVEHHHQVEVRERHRELPAEAKGDISMEEYFHREWQREMFALAVEDLRVLARHKGKDVPLHVFEDHDLVEQPPGYAELARRYGLPETTVTNYLAWARRELRRLLLARLAELTAGERDFHREARELFGPKR